MGFDAQEWLSKTRLTEEVPGVPEAEQYHIWSGPERKVIWHGATAQAGREWAEQNGVVIDEFEPFEP